MRDLEHQPGRAGHEAGDATAIPLRRQPRWGRIALVALLAAAAAWAVGREASMRIENRDIEVAARRQPPAPGFPAASRTIDHNNMIMRMGLVADLDGQAIAYTAEADQLVAGGTFRIDLPLQQVADRLHVNADSLANSQSPHEIDPDAELFRAQSGTLTESAKEVSRKQRRRQMLEGKKPDAVFEEWVITSFSFTLNRLKHPNGDEKIVLAAIIDAAAETMPKPGDKIRAVGVNSGELAPPRMALSVGMLPLQPLEQSSEALFARP